MTGPGPLRRWGQWILVAVVVATTLGTITTVAVNAAHLQTVTADVLTAQQQSATTMLADRELLKLLQMVSELGETTTPGELALQRGLVLRHLAVGVAAFPPSSSQAAELSKVRAALAAFPWDRLGQPGDDRLRLTAMALVAQSERRINAVRSAEEKEFYGATAAGLDANQRSQIGLSVLVAVVLGLGIVGVIVVISRSRTHLARAYQELMGEMSERRAAEDALRMSEGRFRSLVQRASDLTVVTDRTGVITYVSPAAESLLGYPPAELLDQSLLGLVAVDTRPRLAAALTALVQRPGLVHTVELRLSAADGRVRLVESVGQNLLGDANVGGLVWNGRDVTDRRALEARLSHEASHDPLTQLPNRAYLIERLDAALAAAEPDGPWVSVILIDLDGFKSVNDTLGHAAGDELLRAAAKRLLGCLRRGDTAARLGGDEFAVVAMVVHPDEACAAGQRIVDVLRQPFTLVGREVRISASIGVAHHRGCAAAEELLRDADIAMYAAKNTGKGRLEIFAPDMRARVAHRISLQQDLARAVDHGEIEVHYQPIIDLRTQRPRSMEALARWRRPDGELVPAGDFVPIAEESGAIVEIGHEVLRQACHAVRAWRADIPGCELLTIAVNVSAVQVLSGRLADHVEEALRETELPRSTLVLEITESAALEGSAQVTAELDRLRELGARISVDDFGSGYSSLGFLMGLGADAMKIDRTLLDFDTHRHGSLVTAVAELGRTLGLNVVVEGVETAEHLHRALEAQCDAAQGFHISAPLPFDEVAGFLGEWSQQRQVLRPNAATG